MKTGLFSIAGVALLQFTIAQPHGMSLPTTPKRGPRKLMRKEQNRSGGVFHIVTMQSAQKDLVQLMQPSSQIPPQPQEL